MTKKVLGIIPARGGSKGVKEKNIRIVAGKPLIYWSIKSAMESKALDFFCVSSDDKKISQAATEFGAEVVLRPSQLAQDNTPMVPVLQHVCAQVERKFGRFDSIVLLQPTAPMREGRDVRNAIKAFHKNIVTRSLVSVYQVEDCHPSRMYRIEDNILTKIFEEPAGSLRQDLETIYHRNGALYICERDLLMDENKLTCSNPMPFIMPKSRSANIDDEHDLVIANSLLTERHK